jgi:signal transduction histidine kinase
MPSKLVSDAMPTKAAEYSGEFTFREAVARLSRSPDSITWARRRELGHSLRDTFAAGTADEDARLLLHQLAADPKWEVRVAVAEILPFVPKVDFDQIVVRFASDPNTYVRGSYERASSRRSKEDQVAGRARRSAGQVSQDLQAIESMYGKPAAQKALRMAERYCELLVGSMVHDIRSILTHLTSNCHTLMQEAHSGSKAKRVKARVRDDLDFLDATVTDMAAFAQPIPIERRSERLAKVVSDALGLARDNLRKSKLETDPVQVEIQVPESIVVEVARYQIVIAIANVLTNAFEAFTVGTTLRAGRIEVAAALVGEQVRIVVRDDGQGMSEEEIRAPLLSMPGRRNKSKRQSTGYGLPIVARNLAAHGGTVALESRENEGTTVTMTLPLVGV